MTPTELQRWTVLFHTREEINKAGKLLALSDSPDDVPEDALSAIGNWRACHGWPMNTFKLWLLDKAKQVDKTSLVAQRLKRLPSIALKLKRFPGIKLSQMQDIAGCRAILPSVVAVDMLVRKYRKSDLKHELIRTDDYIREPRSSGYRGVHLIYRYYSDKNKTYNDLKVEIQLRSTLQHLWATAVETVGTFTRQALKSSAGETEWLRFFELMGTALALRERAPIVPNTPSNHNELREELEYYATKLDVQHRLQLYAATLRIPEKAGEIKNAKLFLLELDLKAMRLRITGYKANETDKAAKDYLAVERTPLGTLDSVLVSVDSFVALKRAYPNYYLDTHRFIQAVTRAISKTRSKHHDSRQGRLFP
jgi:hypothetical protein